MKRQHDLHQSPAKFALFVSIALCLIAQAGCSTLSPPGRFTVERREIAYAERASGPLLATTFVPTPAPENSALNPRRPIVLLFHGGAFHYGSRDEMTGFAEALARQGFLAATISYRLAPKVQFPAPVADAVAAVRYFRAHASELHGDPDRIGLVGMSAGAYMAMFAAYCQNPDEQFGPDCGDPAVSSRVHAVVNQFGPCDLSYRFDDAHPMVKPLIEEYVGAKLRDDPDLWRRASPKTHIAPGAPPTLTMHGPTDVVVGIEQARMLSDALRAVGTRHELVLLDGGHAWGYPYGTKESYALLPAIMAFLVRELGAD